MSNGSVRSNGSKQAANQISKIPGLTVTKVKTQSVLSQNHP